MPTKKTKIKKVDKAGRYFEATGRRKTAVARVRLHKHSPGEFLINGKPLEKYFPILESQKIVKESLVKTSHLDQFKVLVKVRGGGLHAQAEATRHGISRALIKFDSDYRSMLKKAGLLTRDSRMRERKKFGLKRARRAPQWGKR